MTIVDEKVSKLLLKPQVSALLNEIANFFSREGIRAYIVGGFLRDLLLDRETKDIDIAIKADAVKAAPGLAVALGGSHFPLDTENKVFRIILGGKDSGQWQLDLSSFSGSIEEDLGRRDFTINAMATDLGQACPVQPEARFEVAVIDPFNGLNDLEQGIIRATQQTVFSADPLRLLRAVRLASELGLSIDAGTEALIKHDAHLITAVAGERSREELIRLLALPHSEHLWPYLDELGLVTALIPELSQARGVAQPREHTWDVLNHSIRTIAAVDFLLRQGSWRYTGEEVLRHVPWSAELEAYFAQVVSGSSRRTLTKLAALLHDIAKPRTKMIDANGRTRFFGHPSQGADMTAKILERLRFSVREIKLVEAMVCYHLRPVQMSHTGELPTPRAIYRYFRDGGDTGIETLFLSLADHLATRGPNLESGNWKEHTRVAAYILSERLKQKELTAPPRLITGHDLIKIFGIKPGPKLGEILETVSEALAAQEISTREEALALAADLLKSEAKKC